MKRTGEMQFALWMAGGIKILVVFAWVLWPEIPREVVAV